MQPRRKGPSSGNPQFKYRLCLFLILALGEAFTSSSFSPLPCKTGLILVPTRQGGWERFAKREFQLHMVGIKLGAAMAVHSCIVSWAHIYFICVSHRFTDHLLCASQSLSKVVGFSCEDQWCLV